MVRRLQEPGIVRDWVGLVGVDTLRTRIVSYIHYLTFKERLPDVEFADVTAQFEETRSVKSPEKLKFVRRGRP